MKVTQILSTAIHIKLSEIPNLPAGFKVREAQVSRYDLDRGMISEQSITLVGEIEVPEKA